jgi:predicted dehydrogenase
VIGVALIGTGFWGAQLAAAARRAGLDLVCCFSRDAEKRRAFAERFGCEPAPTLEDALGRPGVRGVILATPNDTHEEQAVAAAARGVHVFVEKPIAHLLPAGRRIRDACERAGVVLAVGHCFRRLGAARRTKELVDEGRLGRVVLAEANFSLPGSFGPEAWRWYRARNAGGPLLQLGIHHADTLAYLLGPIVRTTGKLRRVVTEAEIDDVGVATLEFASGALGALTGSYVSPRTLSLRLFGTDAVLDYQTDMAVWPQADQVDAATTVAVGGDRVAFDHRDVLAEELAEFARCARDGGQPETGAEEGLAALEVILAAADGGRVDAGHT